MWEAWHNGGMELVSGVTFLEAMRKKGVRWLRRAGSSGDYPIWRIDDETAKKYGVVILDDLGKIPFEVYWPQ